jgi:hypothetical protein
MLLLKLREGSAGGSQRGKRRRERKENAHVGERGSDDGTDTEVEKGPRSVLTRRTATEVAAGNDEDLGLAVSGLVEDEVGVLRAVRFVAEGGEDRDTETGTLDGLQEAGGDDQVGVDVGALEGSSDAGNDLELGHASSGDSDGSGDFGSGVRLGNTVIGSVGRLLRRDNIVFGSDLDGRAGRRGVGLGVLASVDEVTSDGGGGGHGGGHKVSAASGTLTALEVAVRSRSATLTGSEHVGVHAEAHRATSFAPVETGLGEDAVKALRLSLLLDETGTGNDHGVDVLSDLATLGNGSSSAEVLDTGVGAGTDENLRKREWVNFEK